MRQALAETKMQGLHYFIFFSQPHHTRLTDADKLAF